MALKKIILNGQVIELPSGGEEGPFLFNPYLYENGQTGPEIEELYNGVCNALSDGRGLAIWMEGTIYRNCLCVQLFEGSVSIIPYIESLSPQEPLSSVLYTIRFNDIDGNYHFYIDNNTIQTSQLVNDSNFISAEEIATINGQSLTKGGDITISGGAGNVPTKTSDLTNDSGFITANDNVASATKLANIRYLNGVPFDGSANAINYAVCSTPASTTAKAVSISRFSLVTGAQVRVEFNSPNTASAPTLNVGSTGAKRMSYKGSLITNTNFTFNPTKIYTFTYDGTYWVLEGDWDEAPKKISDLTNNNFISCEFMGEVGDVIWSDDDQDRIEHIENWIDELGMGKVCVLDFDDEYYSSVIAFNFRTDANFGMGRCHFSYIFDGYLYDVEYESVSLPVTITIVNKTKIGDEGGSNTDGGAEPMVCAYRITSYTANHIELDNYTYNGQTMNYREGAIILITNPLGEDVVFEGGTLTLDGNEYEADAFTIKVGATTLFTLGVDSGILFPVSSVVESNSGGSSEGEGSTTKEVVWVGGDTIDLLEPNKIYLLSAVSNSLQISEIAYPEGVYAEYCIMSNGSGFGGNNSSMSLILPDNMAIYWAGESQDSLTIGDIWELSIVYTSTVMDEAFKCVLTKFT